MFLKVSSFHGPGISSVQNGDFVDIVRPLFDAFCFKIDRFNWVNAAEVSGEILLCSDTEDRDPGLPGMPRHGGSWGSDCLTRTTIFFT